MDKKIDASKFVKDLQKQLGRLNHTKKNKSNVIRSKKKNIIDPVTKLDLEIEKFIRLKIKKKYPNHSIIGEEFKDEIKNSDFKWIIDPIDGTKNLIMGMPTWSNLIGLYKGEKSILSFANFPILNKYYIAYDKKCLIKEGTNQRKISSNKKVNFNNIRLAVNTLGTIKKKNVSNFLKKFQGIFKITGSDAYNFCLIAEGKLDILIECGLKKVDFYPLISIIKNSGAIITDWNGKMNFPRGDVLVAANRKLHHHVLKKIRTQS